MPVDFPDPGQKHISQSKQCAESGKEAARRYTKRARCQHEGPQWDWRRQQRRSNGRKERVAFHPLGDLTQQRDRPITAQCPPATLPADMPSGVSTQHTASDRTRNKEPRIAATRRHPQEQQIGWVRNWQRDQREVYSGNGKETDRAEMNEPVQRM